MVVGGGWWLVIGGWWRLVFGGWWPLAVGGRWQLVVCGPLGRSLRAALNKKILLFLKDRPDEKWVF